jgi:hypothetical protein
MGKGACVPSWHSSFSANAIIDSATVKRGARACSVTRG